MKHSLTVSLFILLLTFVTSCALISSTPHRIAASNDPNGAWISMQDTAAQAQVNMNRIDLGMTKDTVFKIMGTKTHYGVKPYHHNTTIPHPYKREILNYDGIDYEVLYYYTYYVRGDESLTPIVLKDGKVIGWGWTYLRSIESNSNLKKE